MRGYPKEFFSVALFLLIVVFIVFYPASAGKGLIYSGDFTGSDGLDLNLPLKAHLGDSIRSMKLPLWTPNLFCGFPLLCEGQTGMFYPPNILFSIFPPLWCFNGLVFFHLLLAGLGIFYYCKFKELSWQASIIAATAFTFNSFFILHLRQLNLFEAASWLPLLLLFAEKQIKRRNIIDIFPWIIILCLQWTIGHPAATYIGLFGISILYFIAWINDIRTGKSKNRYYFYPLCFLAGSFFSGMLAAIQLLPTYELIPQSKRASISIESASIYPFYFNHLIHLASPFFLGNPAVNSYPMREISRVGVFWENCIYIGIIPLILFLLSIKYWKSDTRVRYFSYITVFGLLMAFGTKTPVFHIFWRIVPGFHNFRFPSRFLIYSILAMIMLSGLAWEHISKNIKNNSYKNILLFFVLLFMIGNSLWFNRSFNTTVPPSWLSKPETMKYIQNEKEPYRIHSFLSLYAWQISYIDDSGWMGEKKQLNEIRNLLSADYSLIFNVPQSGEKTYDEGGMSPSRRADIELMSDRKLSKCVVNNVAYMPMEVISVFKMMNVKYVTSMIELSYPSLRLISENKDKCVKVYQLSDTLPRAFVVTKYKLAKTPEEALDLIFSNTVEFFSEIILEEDPKIKGENDDTGTINNIIYSDDTVDVDVTMKSEGLLFVSDIYFPGWQVYIDGKKGKILRANYAFRAVTLSPGNHKVVFRYQPSSFIAGAFISILSLVIMVALILFMRFKFSDEVPGVNKKEIVKRKRKK